MDEKKIDKMWDHASRLIADHGLQSVYEGSFCTTLLELAEKETERLEKKLGPDRYEAKISVRFTPKKETETMKCSVCGECGDEEDMVAIDIGYNACKQCRLKWMYQEQGQKRIRETLELHLAKIRRLEAEVIKLREQLAIPALSNRVSKLEQSVAKAEEFFRRRKLAEESTDG